MFETSQEGVYAIGDAADYEGKVALIASGFGEAPTAINQAIKYIYPDRDNRVVHSTSLIKKQRKISELFSQVIVLTPKKLDN